ncbi:MAG: hypothetical protein IPL61_03800 [Myxococcales bacterium]|nr:hypothetical protein [Myxococcales bacterium]
MWRDPTPPEWLALVAGLKPALRLQRAPRRALAEAAAARRRGFAVELTALPDRTIVYIAATPAAARALRALEAQALPGQPARAEVSFDPAPHRGLGAALGFPTCCVEAFVARIARGADVLASGARAHEDFIAASEAATRSRRLDARANVFARDHVSGWLSHVPCAFDCAPSLAYADRVIAAYRAHDRAGADELIARLGQAVAIDRTGRRTAPGEAAPDACVLAFADPA